MKSYVANGTGSEQTLTGSQDEKIPVYDSETDLDADLANLADGQIVATKDTGSELSAPVDTVQSGNMHAVTSNAVAQFLSNFSANDNAGNITIGKIYIEWGHLENATNQAVIFSKTFSKVPFISLSILNDNFSYKSSVTYPTVNGFTFDSAWGQVSKPAVTANWLAIGILP